MTPLLEKMLPRLVEVDHGMETPCLVWIGKRQTNGYGQVYLSGGRYRVAHVVYYEETVGPIPGGKVLDHTCPENACVRHTEPVTQRENVLRGIERHGLHYHRRKTA